jgi:hypothetical protein
MVVMVCGWVANEHFRVEDRRRTWSETVAEMQTGLTTASSNAILTACPRPRHELSHRHHRVNRRHKKGEHARAKPNPESRLTYYRYGGARQPVRLSEYPDFALAICLIFEIPLSGERSFLVSDER